MFSSFGLGAGDLDDALVLEPVAPIDMSAKTCLALFCPGACRTEVLILADAPARRSYDQVTA